MTLEDLTLKELYELKKELLYHVVGMSYNMQVVFQINKLIGEKELKLEKGVKYDNDRN